MSINRNKKSIVLDYSKPEDRALAVELGRRADIALENMKPGALGRFGFGPAEIATINPALVYCSVSGFGAGSPLAGRPAMDSTIQGMAGVMDLTRQDGTPYKVGISISDILGGQFALLAVLAGLDYRERTGKGQSIDLSMQEVSAWLTQVYWNADGAGQAAGSVVKCRDGYVYIENGDARGDGVAQTCAAMGKAAAAKHFSARGMRCVPVNSVSEVATHPQTVARELIVQGLSRDGRAWPLLACPIRLQPLQPAVRRAIAAVGADLAEVLRDWGIEDEGRAAVDDQKLRA